MTTTNVNINNLYHFQFDDNYTICYGEIASNVKKADAINIPGNMIANSHVVLETSDTDYLFKRVMEKAPLINTYDLILYDHSSTVIAKYPKEKSMLSSVNFISEIKLPHVGEDEIVYLIINNYKALDDVCMEDSIKVLVQKDFYNFMKNNSHLEKEQIKLFINESIYKKINSYIEFSNIFDKVIVNPSITECLVEHLMGKLISCSEVSYQTSLMFSEDIDILSTTISPDSKSKLIGRSNKIMQLNIYTERDKFKFVTLLKHHKPLKKLSLSSINTASTEVSSIEIFQESIDDYSKWIELKNNVIFFNKLEDCIKIQNFLHFINDNSSKVVKYIFGNEVLPVVYSKEKNNLIEYTCYKIHKSIIYLLNNCKRKNDDLNFKSPIPLVDYQELGRQYSAARVFYDDFE
jgi:hypothetical protein